ncbi:Malignant T-cell-amplified sequence 1 [Hypsizygus marmoreus]|uniref:Translation machinery-associated protein 20 n=1 Tax=Hypsizygus marmoreus TaxID=39966 RepID=A0A369JPA1_HYPMA|nr:Malignant T-cell-amplified sequence 1 [Hypsizygus marmoreus]
MFKKFSPSTDIAGQTPVKSSVQRAIRAAVLSQWKIEPETLEAIWPKKEGLVHVKCREHISIYTVHGEPLIIQHFDGPYYPTLRLLHKYPYILPKVGIDRGAIRFLLAGAPMMCPGLTSKGGYLPPADAALPAGTPVAIHAEGKDNAVGIGLMKLGSEEMRRINKDVGVEVTTYLGDDLWALKAL